MSQAIFKNHQQSVAAFLNKSQLSIDIAMCWFTNPILFSILLKKAKTGVQVRLIVQFDQANFHPKGLPFYQLERSGGSLRVYNQKQLLHHKFAIIDGEYLLTGSYNWTGTQHAENLLILKSAELANAYLSEFEQLWGKAELLVALANKKPPRPAFQKLFKPIAWNVHDLRHAIILKRAQVWISVFKEEELLIWKQCLQLQRHFLKIETDFFKRYPGDWEPDVFEEWSEGLGLIQKRLLNNYCKRMRSGDVIIAATRKRKLLGAGMVGSNPESSHLQNYPFARFVQWFEFSDDAELLGRLPWNHFGRFFGSGLQVLSLLEQKKMAV